MKVAMRSGGLGGGIFAWWRDAGLFFRSDVGKSRRRAAIPDIIPPHAFVFGFATPEDAFADERRSDSCRIHGVPPESTKLPNRSYVSFC
jgi:hypothetical protein